MAYSEHFYLVFIISLLIAGVIAGIIAGLLGIGGGLVLVPVLFYLFSQMGVDSSICMHMAVGTSLAAIVVTSTSSAHSHYKKGSVDLNLIKHWVPWLLLGSVLAMSIFGSVKSKGLTYFFAAMTFTIAMYMLFGPTNKNPEDAVGNVPSGPKRYLSG